MNNTATLTTGLQTIITGLQKEKEALSNSYNTAIKNGEKYESIKSLYLVLKDIDVKLRNLSRINFSKPTII